MSLKNIVKCILCDMDGVLRIGFHPIPGIQNIFSYFKTLKIQPMIITNECRYTNKKIYDDLKQMKIIDDDTTIPLITSANVCKAWLERYIYNNNSRYDKFNVCIIGEKGLQENVKNVQLNNLSFDFMLDTNSRTQNIIILGSLFNYTENHKQIIKKWLSNPHTFIVKTCNDNSDPECSCILPNTILHNFNRDADVNIGKPDNIFSQEIDRLFKKMNLSHIHSNEIMLVGDTMNTDIKMGKNMGYKTTLVLSGNTKISDLKTYTYSPDYILPSLEYIKNII